MKYSKLEGIQFGIENYIGISEFEGLNNKTKDASLIAAIIGYVEGIIRPGKDKTYFTIAGMYKVKCSSNYILLSVYNLINNNSNVFNYIVNYFNLWHNKDFEEFSYDQYNKNDLKNNFNELISLLWEESYVATNSKDKKVIEVYNLITKGLSDLYMNGEVTQDYCLEN